MKLKIYEYKNCGTCQKALKFLDQNQLKYERIPIVDQPPTPVELARMLTLLKASGGTFKSLFNVSGQQYRELRIAEKIKAGLSEKEALRLLADNGKLIKRPFLLGDKLGFVGFKADQWKALL